MEVEAEYQPDKKQDTHVFNSICKSNSSEKDACPNKSGQLKKALSLTRNRFIVKALKKKYFHIVRRKRKNGLSNARHRLSDGKVLSKEAKTFVCAVCSKDCHSSIKLKSHLVSHSNIRPYFCKDCDKTFKTRSALRNHKVIHSEVANFVCEYSGCEKRFKLRSHLKSHVFTHIEEKAFVCTFKDCGKAYKTSANLRDHIHKHTDFQTVYLCPVDSCNKSFPQLRSLNRHRIRMHSPRPKQFPCSEEGCHRVFKSKGGLKEHMLVHVENKPLFRCSECSRLLGSQSSLSRHKKRVHTDERQYTCTVCGKSFKTGDNLKVHEFIHKGERPHVCQYPGCGKTFVTRSNLKQHVYIHTGEKPNLCECGVQFRSNKSLRDHRVAAHGVVLNTVSSN